ncbi:protein ILRUN [Chelonus insularis]|uniref:protein ILRUN n=1 Tax=Chelonus insularis TaxID=460826 RepID=UPI00158F5509|nr:protein ILRUN [Chelonus insularis]XP_034950116.1 protein ILRUN [Chelonus insularis]
MDVDDFDQHLLQQFSCMGTTDKDDLVKQLQRLLAGSQLNEATATFFLDMNNWNLQAAICSYFDFESPFKLPSMSLICDSTIGEGESVSPNTKFQKSWKVQNSGNESWPEGLCLQYTSGAVMGDCTKVDVPTLRPKEITEISVTLTSPNELGVFQSKWRMMTPSGSYFGDVIWVIITVSETGTLAVTQQLHQLSTSQSNDVQMS